MIGESIDSAFSVRPSFIGRLKQAENAKCIETVGYECVEVEDTSSEVDCAECPGLMVLCLGLMVLSVLG